MRIDFDTLNPPVRAAVQAHTGAVRASRNADAGTNSEIAALLDTESGRVFIKGVPEDHAAIAMQQCEVAVNPSVRDIVGPRVLWHETAAGWHLVAFEVIEGTHANYAPSSPDLPKLSAVMNTLTQIPCPPVRMFSAERRWCTYVDDPADAKHFAGTSLLHTDYHRHNVLITDDRAWLVDWALATRGAAFIDLACLIPRLIAAGHSPNNAEAWAAQHTVWRAADPLAVTLFARAIARLWRQLANNDPDAAWRRPMVEAARSWAIHRALQV